MSEGGTFLKIFVVCSDKKVLDDTKRYLIKNHSIFSSSPLAMHEFDIVIQQGSGRNVVTTNPILRPNSISK